MTDYTNWTTEKLEALKDSYSKCSCDSCPAKLGRFLAELARREGQLKEQWETVTVRAEEIKKGDRLYGYEVCQFQDGVLHSIQKRWFYNADSATIAMLPRTAIVVVERPIKTITITDTINPEEAHEIEAWWGEMRSDSAVALDRVKARVAEAVRKAQA